MASLVYSYKNLYDDISSFLGTYGSSGPAGQDLTDAKNIVNAGYRRFLSAYNWSFLRELERVITTSGVWEYELPENFSVMIGAPHYSLGANYQYLLRRDYGLILEMRAGNDMSSFPEYFAIRAGSYSPEAGQRSIMGIYPAPDSAYTLFVFYHIFPPKLENDADIPVGPLDVVETIRGFCLAEAELFMEEKAGVQEGKARMLLTDAIRMDINRRSNSLGYFGPVPYEVSGRGPWRVNQVTYTTG